MSNQSKDSKKKNPALQLIAGGTAGFVESTICHPLDTIKTRMQLRRQQSTINAVRARSSLMEPGMRHVSSLTEPKLRVLHEASSSHAAKQPQAVAATLGPFGTARRIVEREGFMSLYKGLTAVWCGIIPKMAIRFLTFEQYRESLQKIAGPPANGEEYSTSVNFTAGLACGLTEAVMIVTPAEVCKIRMQSQYNSLIDPSQLARRKYTNVIQTAFTISREEGITALYK
jgi:solute carrier family 25 citrate transporter 1